MCTEEYVSLFEEPIGEFQCLRVLNVSVLCCGRIENSFKKEFPTNRKVIKEKELEAGILALNSKLYQQSTVPPPFRPLVPVDETQLFDEDPDLVAEDRRRVLEEGSSDALLMEGA